VSVRPPISVVAFGAGGLGDPQIEADLWAAMDALHRSAAKLLARNITSPADARKLLELGSDFLCGVAPARALI
jgi:hypothetical protein